MAGHLVKTSTENSSVRKYRVSILVIDGELTHSEQLRLVYH